VVFCCQGPDGEEVALKWMDHPTQALVRRFELEISTLERIDDPLIVQHRDHGEWEGRPYLVMELLRGHDLRVLTDKLHKRPPQERYQTVRQIGQDLCRALEHLHRLGLVHRDVKPSNVMCTDDGRVVLSDFGIVKDLEREDRTEAGMMIGTMAFAAPEQMDGERVDTRADLFGLGATLYFMLTAKRPYSCNPRPPSERPIAPSVHEPGIPPGLEAVVLRLMAHQPAHRYPDARAASIALSRGKAEGVPIAGRQEALAIVARALRAAEAGQSVCLRPSGPLGAGKGWLADVVRQGARVRGVQAHEVRESEASGEALGSMQRGEPCVVVDAVGLDLPEGVRLIEVPLVPLGLADVRRTVVGVAPETEEPALVADRLHRLTGGIPGLLVPLITRYSSDHALVLPEVVEMPALVDAFFENLGLDEMEILGVVALAWPPPSTDLIEAVSQVPSPEYLEMMRARGLVYQSHGEWNLGASLFRSRVLDAVPDPDGVLARIKQHRQQHDVSFRGLSSDIGAILERGRQQILSGAIRAGLSDISRAGELARGLQDRALEALALRSLGLALKELGQLDQALDRLADATALARASDQNLERRICHVLRASISLSLGSSDSSGALSALDRLMPLEVGSRKRQCDRADRMMHAVWAEVCASLGDQHGGRQRESLALTGIESEDAVWRARIRLCLARAAKTAGDLERSEAHLVEARSDAEAYPLLLWWVEAASNTSKGKHTVLPLVMAQDLSSEQVQALEDLANR
jgi:tetratricopeptide (TPR) repeat protein